MAENKMIERYIFIFQQEDLENKNIHELIKDIWTFSDKYGKACYVCTRYREWAIEALKTKWKDDYVDIEMVVHCLYVRNISWLKNSSISTEDNFTIYNILEK